ncbi:MAG: tRNA (guanosine(37)-N1)-methyltransferase TrmD [Burkholderiaceae bacterium]|nr:tRNA (guanosine(37)-N1)-methyltransferase TrmD [Burkholderiaceae bacterium]
MRFDVLTLFPELFAPFLTHGVTHRAYSSGQVQVVLWNPRDYAQGNYRRVDDRPFGGGPGMVMLAQPLAACLEAVRAARAADGQGNESGEGSGVGSGAGEGHGHGGSGATAPVILFSPGGQGLNHRAVQRWATSAGAILVCGRYEGIDQRFIDAYITHQISLGDFVLSGGEIAAMALLDAVARLQPGVLGDPDSHAQDSFNPVVDGLLDCPHYTRPEIWQGQSVPAPLLSGHHAQIERWRRDQRLQLTAHQRPDLIEAARAAGRLNGADEQVLGKA